MIRICDGTDPNLTRYLPAAEYDATRHNLSPWKRTGQPGEIVIQCDCGLTFDDVYREVIWPHHTF